MMQSFLDTNFELDETWLRARHFVEGFRKENPYGHAEPGSSIADSFRAARGHFLKCSSEPRADSTDRK